MEFVLLLLEGGKFQEQISIEKRCGAEETAIAGTPEPTASYILT